MFFSVVLRSARRLWPVLLIMTGIPIVALAQLTETELRMVATIDSRHAVSLELLEKTVNINSGSMNFEGVKEVGEIFLAEFAKLGFALPGGPDADGRYPCQKGRYRPSLLERWSVARRPV